MTANQQTAVPQVSPTWRVQYQDNWTGSVVSLDVQADDWQQAISTASGQLGSIELGKSAQLLYFLRAFRR